MAAITLYQYSGEPQRADKTSMLTSAVQISPLIYRDSIDFHAPVFDVQQDLSAAINYAKIEQDGRTWYYFCRIENIKRGLSRVYCDIDVLMSFDVMQVPIIPARTSAVNNPYIVDPRQPVETTEEHFNILFSGANLDYNNMCLIAGIVGTGGEPTNM